jgi:uncharacterized protein
MATETVTVAARTGSAVRLVAGKSVEIGNPQGTQVVDTWALRASDPLICLSMSVTRAMLAKLVPEVGDALYGSDRAPLLTLTDDTSPGVHDTLLAACDPERYRLLGAQGPHASCADNFARALRELGVASRPVPDPLNLFMNIPWSDDGRLQYRGPVGKPGDYVRLRAEADVIVVVSACPQDMNPVNGENGPSDITWRILD